MTNGRQSAIKALLASSCLLTLNAFANPPHLPDMVTLGNKWQLVGFDDGSTLHTQGVTQTLCFFSTGTVGTHQRYRWVSTTFGGWDGMATQEGDQVSMHGDFTFILQPNAGHDSLEFELTTAKEATGHWREWIENAGVGQTIIWNNAKLTRVGTCPQKSSAEALEFAKSVPNVDAFGVPVVTPSGVDPAKLPLDFEDVAQR
jgi:hypothetical protein